MKSQLCAGIAALVLAVGISNAGAASILITEVMSSGSTSDWFELTNFGSTAIDLSNYKMDDSSFALGSAVALIGVASIAPGESVIFVQGDTTDVNAFRTLWGGLALTAQIGYHVDGGTGLGAGGDGVVIYDGGGAEVTRVSFSTATPNKTFGFDSTQSTQAGFGAISVLGQNGAYNSANTPTNLGSPGAIPEPGSMSLIAAAGVVLALRRNRSAAKLVS